MISPNCQVRGCHYTYPLADTSRREMWAHPTRRTPMARRCIDCGAEHHPGPHHECRECGDYADGRSGRRRDL